MVRKVHVCMELYVFMPVWLFITVWIRKSMGKGKGILKMKVKGYLKWFPVFSVIPLCSSHNWSKWCVVLAGGWDIADVK